MKHALEGVRVLDLSHALAGPFCSTMLADFGAQVIKVEPPGGEISRNWGSPLPGGADNDYFSSLHRNKQGIVLDLKQTAARELLLEMASKCDVLLENFRVGVMDKLGLGYEAIRQRNPQIVYCSISGFGQDGPYRDRAGMDMILQAESGMISVTGEQGGRGVRCGVSIADITAGNNAALAILMALRVKEQSGQGQYLDVSMMEGQVSLLRTLLSEYLYTGQMPVPMGNTYKPILPYQVFRTRTRDIALAVGTEKLWRDFCAAIARPELADDARYASNAARMKNRQSLVDTLQEVLQTKSYEEWEAIFVPQGIPAGAINNMEELVAHPQLAARKTIVDVPHPRAGTVRMVGVPFRMSATPGEIRHAAPMLGEHSRQVLADMLGIDEQRFEALAEAGVFGPNKSAAI